YTLTLTLTDAASGQSGHATFGGTLGGSAVNLTNSFTTPTAKHLLLGDTSYTVTLGPYFKPVSPFPGFIGATVEAAPPAKDAPEPATLALAAFALPGLVLAVRRRKQTATCRVGRAAARPTGGDVCPLRLPGSPLVPASGPAPDSLRIFSQSLYSFSERLATLYRTWVSWNAPWPRCLSSHPSRSSPLSHVTARAVCSSVPFPAWEGFFVLFLGEALSWARNCTWATCPT